MIVLARAGYTLAGGVFAQRVHHHPGPYLRTPTHFTCTVCPTWMLTRCLGALNLSNESLARKTRASQWFHLDHLHDTTPINVHCMCIIPVKITDYSQIMFHAFTDQLFWKLCQHIRLIPNQKTLLFTLKLFLAMKKKDIQMQLGMSLLHV